MKCIGVAVSRRCTRAHWDGALIAECGGWVGESRAVLEALNALQRKPGPCQVSSSLAALPKSRWMSPPSLPPSSRSSSPSSSPGS